VCIVAELQPVEMLESLRGRTHLARIIGIGHQRSMGLKGGAVVDLEAAEIAIRRRARGRADGEGRDPVRDRQPSRAGASARSISRRRSRARHRGQRRPAPRARVASGHNLRPGRAVLHALPTGFSLDQQHHIVDPDGMMGEKLGRRPPRGHVGGGRRPQPDARRRALPPRRRGRHRDALRLRPLRASWTTRPTWAASSSTWAAAPRASACSRTGTSSTRTPSRSAGTTSPWTSPRAHDPGRGGRAAQDALRLGHRLALGRPRHDRGAAGGRGRARHPRTTYRNRISCASSSHGSRRFSNSCATGSRAQASPPRPDAGSFSRAAQASSSACRKPRAASCRDRFASGVPSASRAFPRPQRVPPFRRWSASWLSPGGAYRVFRAAVERLVPEYGNRRLLLAGGPVDSRKFLKEA
jgi:hypothetical protein